MHDHVQVVVGDAQRRLARGVEAPLEHVALDDEGTGEVAVLGPLGGRPDVDDDGPGLHRVEGLDRREPVQSCAGGREQQVDAAGHQSAPAARVRSRRRMPSSAT